MQFSAYLSRQETIRKKRPIRFDKILQNDGKCYKIATGIFEYVCFNKVITAMDSIKLIVIMPTAVQAINYTLYLSH